MVAISFNIMLLISIYKFKIPKFHFNFYLVLKITLSVIHALPNILFAVYTYCVIW